MEILFFQQALLILPRGTTGFRRYDDAELRTVDLRAFSAVLHTVARDASATVVHNPRRNPDTASSFADALLEFTGQSVAVLLNCFHPMIAFANESRLGGNLDFLDHAELKCAFSAHPEFIVLSAETLMHYPATESLADLAPVEIEQFNYWKPSRLGDVIFNNWD